ncbi:antirestriction protein ArdC [Bradyrhizobium sp. S3.2.6]
MSRQYSRAHTGEDRANLYDEITSKIIAELEAGRVPWVQPWGSVAAKAPLAMPKSAASGRQYSGINVLILWGAATERAFTGQSWLTFRQALSLGGHVRKGERGTTVVYADRFVPVDEKRRASENGEEAQAIPFLKRFTVYDTGDLSLVAKVDLPEERRSPQVDTFARAAGPAAWKHICGPACSHSARASAGSMSSQEVQ